MSIGQAQVSGEPAENAVVCPQCGAVLERAGANVKVVAAGPGPETPVTWHSTRPDYPPPPGCRRIRLPFRGFLDVDDDIRRRVERFFSLPMLTLALLVLPLLVVDYYLSRGREHETWLSRGVLIAHFTISVAFLLEFLVKINIAQSRLGYLALNWIDPIIIILPFLRVFQALRLLRSLEAARVVQFSRLYALRGVGLKALRTMIPVLLGLRFTQRFRANPAGSTPATPDYSKWPRAALMLELERLQKKLVELEKGQTSKTRE